MNGDFELAQFLVNNVRGNSLQISCVDVVWCPPAVYLQHVGALIKEERDFYLGAQNVSEHESGAFTGEVSSKMLQEAGCSYVITGHSERRHLFGETNEVVAKKTLAVLQQDMIPIACVGETHADREHGNTQMVIEQQLRPILELCSSHSANDMVVAYEPVWAIGTGKVASPDMVAEVHGGIREMLTELIDDIPIECRILYGGSVNSDNAESLLSQPNVDGCLVGGASLKPAQFAKICQIAAAESN